ncbi:MAG: hypothetical protein K9M07_01930 [Simkaniaceae bacterium]|nr:hypothetical protein [Simkaniaceae bacterium]MCF7851980.1 hypothetical protein [Simkaniaceae bacterium]
MKTLFYLMTLLVLSIGAWWGDRTHPEYRAKVIDFFSPDNFNTLEVKYTAEQLMDTQMFALLKSDEHRYLDPETKYYPYLLMEVKYPVDERTTNEGVILWDMIDGEMVINEQNWEKTSGFGDCIKAKVDKSEFKIINLLAQRGGNMDRDTLSKYLRVENEILDGWIESCRQKKLIVQSGNDYRLHMQTPRLHVIPETHVSDKLVTKTFRKGGRIPRRFSPAQIKRISEAAFGSDFVVRKATKVFLPVCTISVENPDGSMHTSYWNTLNGKELSFYTLFE